MNQLVPHHPFPKGSSVWSPNSSICRKVIQLHGGTGKSSGCSETKVQEIVHLRSLAWSLSPAVQENCV